MKGQKVQGERDNARYSGTDFIDFHVLDAHFKRGSS